jgi:hypothetical protein
MMVDLDSCSVEDLLVTVWKGLRAGLKLHKIAVSPSGKGFHVYFLGDANAEENIKFRALLDDDPYRLRYSIKRWALGGQVDISFQRTGYGKEKVIHDENKKLFDEEKLKSLSLEDVVKMASEVKVEVSPYYITCIGLNGNAAIYERIKQICEDTFRKDETFKFRVYPSYFEQYEKLLVVQSPNRDQAFQRGEWLKRVLLKELGLEVQYWVKAMKEKI